MGTLSIYIYIICLQYNVYTLKKSNNNNNKKITALGQFAIAASLYKPNISSAGDHPERTPDGEFLFVVNTRPNFFSIYPFFFNSVIKKK